MYVDVLDYD